MIISVDIRMTFTHTNNSWNFGNILRKTSATVSECYDIPFLSLNFKSSSEKTRVIPPNPLYCAQFTAQYFMMSSQLTKHPPTHSPPSFFNTNVSQRLFLFMRITVCGVYYIKNDCDHQKHQLLTDSMTILQKVKWIMLLHVHKNLPDKSPTHEL